LAPGWLRKCCGRSVDLTTKYHLLDQHYLYLSCMAHKVQEALRIYRNIHRSIPSYVGCLTGRQSDRVTDRYAGNQTQKQTDMQAIRHRNRQICRQSDRETDRYASNQPEKQTNRQTDRLTDGKMCRVCRQATKGNIDKQTYRLAFTFHFPFGFSFFRDHISHDFLVIQKTAVFFWQK
jgi:hypothetical protein